MANGWSPAWAKLVNKIQPLQTIGKLIGNRRMPCQELGAVGLCARLQRGTG